MSVNDLILDAISRVMPEVKEVDLKMVIENQLDDISLDQFVEAMLEESDVDDMAQLLDTAARLQGMKVVVEKLTKEE